MEEFEEKSHLRNNPQNQDLGFQSYTPIDNDNLVKILAQELENLTISCENEVRDRDLVGGSVVMDEDDEVKRAIAEELLQLVVKLAVNEAIQAESSSEVAENVRRFDDEAIERQDLKKVVEEDPKECRVLEDTEAGENGLGLEKEANQVDDDDNKDADLKDNHEVEIEIEHDSSEIGGYEFNGDERSHDGEFENGDELENDGGSMTAGNDGRPKRYHYPLRPDAEDCSYYMRTGMCKFGSNCKFNHPLRRINQQPAKETIKQKEENSERPAQNQIECKYYLSTGCKYGKSCKYSHGRGKMAVTPVVEYNFLGLPIRPGEKECPYYMRNGSCKYGPNCRFNHPDPSAVGGDAPSTYGNGGPVPLQGAAQPTMPSWSGPRTPDRAAAFVTMMYSPTQSMPPPNPDWNGFPAPAAPTPVYASPERSLPIPPAFFLNTPPNDTNLYTHHQQQMLVSEYPERPGQPECSYFLKTGDCKYKSACKFHHPKSRVTRTAPSVLSDKGLPLRPDQNICTHYSRYGICKYGPACKYDHPANHNPRGGGRGGDGIQQSV